MIGNNKSTLTKEKMRDREKSTQFNEKIESNRNRDLRWSEKHFSNKSSEFNQIDSKEQDENQNYQNRRNGKKYPIIPNPTLKENIEAINSGDKINKSFSKGFSSNKFDVDEYKGLSYLNQKSSPNRSDDTNSTELDNDQTKSGNKKSVDVDFRQKYKTEICKFWELNKECRYGNNCAFAHGFEDIRSKTNISNNYKTKKCKQFYDTGYCPYGSRCQFLHNELRKLSTPSPHNLFNVTNVSYRKILESFVSKFLLTQTEEKENNTKSRPRLKTFTLIANNYSDNFNAIEWNSSPYLIEVDGFNSNNNNDETHSNNFNDSLINLTMDSLLSGHFSDSHEQ